MSDLLDSISCQFNFLFWNFRPKNNVCNDLYSSIQSTAIYGSCVQKCVPSWLAITDTSEFFQSENKKFYIQDLKTAKFWVAKKCATVGMQIRPFKNRIIWNPDIFKGQFSNGRPFKTYIFVQFLEWLGLFGCLFRTGLKTPFSNGVWVLNANPHLPCNWQLKIWTIPVFGSHWIQLVTNTTFNSHKPLQST